jgi:hypothetical protein
MATTAITRFTTGGRSYTVYRIDHCNDCGYRYSRIYGRADHFVPPYSAEILRPGWWSR